METKELLTGRCLCGSVTYKCYGKPTETESCHCTMCRRCSGAPFVAYAMFLEEDVTFLAKDKSNSSIIREFKGLVISDSSFFRVFKSSSSASRAFCQGCGSALAFQVWFIFYINIREMIGKENQYKLQFVLWTSQRR